MDWLQQMKRKNAKAFDYLSAIELHAYFDFATSPQILDDVQRQFPSKDIWYSEMSFGVALFTKEVGPRLGSWPRAERLLDILMSDFKHWTVGYIDWNLMLDHQGGPNYANNQIDAPIILSEDRKQMYKQPMFYVMAHFSKFIPSGSVRIDATINVNSTANALAFLRPDNKITIIIHNNGTEAVDLMIHDKLMGGFSITVKAKSINSLVYAAASPQDADRARFNHELASIWTLKHWMDYLKENN